MSHRAKYVKITYVCTTYVGTTQQETTAHCTAKSEVIFDDRFSLKVLLISRDGQIPLDSRYFSSISFVYNEICTNEKAFTIQITPHFKTDLDLISRLSRYVNRRSKKYHILYYFLQFLRSLDFQK